MPVYRLVVFRYGEEYSHADLIAHMRDAAGAHRECFNDPDLYMDLYVFLNQRLLPHHFEVVPTTVTNDEVTYYDAMVVLHVPDPLHAFEIRLNFDLLPMRPNWRELFTTGRQRPPEWWR